MLQIKMDEFFTPTSETTVALIKRLNEKRSNRFQELRDRFGTHSSKSEQQEWADLDNSYLEALRTYGDDQQQLKNDQRWLREIIYHFFGRLAHRLGNQQYKDYDLKDCISKGMSARLGLRASSDSPLLIQLANEFGGWLSNREDRAFVAGWGALVNLGDDILRVQGLEQPINATASKAFAGSASGSRFLQTAPQSAAVVAQARERDR